MSPIQNRYDVGPALGALDSYDRRRSLDVDELMHFTVQLGDFSDSFAVEAIESRVFASTAVNAAAGMIPVVAIIPRTRPVVIERMRVRTTFSQSFTFGPRGTAGHQTGATRDLTPIDIGGEPSQAEFWWSSQAAFSGSGATMFTDATSWWWTPDQVRTYIKPGERLHVAGAVDDALLVEAIVREIAALPSTR